MRRDGATLPNGKYLVPSKARLCTAPADPQARFCTATTDRKMSVGSDSSASTSASGMLAMLSRGCDLPSMNAIASVLPARSVSTVFGPSGAASSGSGFGAACFVAMGNAV